MSKTKKRFITVRGARVHNLRNVDIDIPRNAFIVITGVSGSGKSSLAFDTLYAEGQRRYVESLSAYARQFLGVMDKPDVDRIEGLSPAISIDQRTVSHNPRSTVGTTTEIYDYLRLLFARAGMPHCPKCGKSITRQSATDIVDYVISLPDKSSVVVTAPLVLDRKGEHKTVFETIERAGFLRVRVDGDLLRIEEAVDLDIDPKKRHTVEAVVDRLVVDVKEMDRPRIADSVETALKMGNGMVGLVIERPRAKKPEEEYLSEAFACVSCGINIPEIEPRTFSFNSPHGACQRCTGLGYTMEIDPDLVVPNPKLSIAEGAVRPWAQASHRVGRQGWYWRQLRRVSERHDISIEMPWKDIPEGGQDIILFGDEGLIDGRKKPFEGVIPNLERRYHETESDHTRGEIGRYMVRRQCSDCEGARLKPIARSVLIDGASIAEIVELPIGQARKRFVALENNRTKVFPASLAEVARPLLKEIRARLSFLEEVGLNYLTLNRESSTLAGGEAQRIRLATQIGSKLAGVLYILDEPSIGLHPRDHDRILDTLRELRDLGNTVIVVEHDADTMKSADQVIDIGPGAGVHGGAVVFQGTPTELKKAPTLTGKYLSGKESIDIAGRITRHSQTRELVIRGARQNNLKNIDVAIPLGMFVCLTGVSGSGKSSLLDDTLAKALAQQFHKAREEPGDHDSIEGTQYIDKVIFIDQSPIGRTPRSNAATYTGVFSDIRDLFSKTVEAKARGYRPGRFSFNVKGGRCEECQGQGMKTIEMHFLPDVYVECDVCRGTRYNRETLEVEYKGLNVAQVLDLTVEEALVFFKSIPTAAEKLQVLNDVGLGYLRLGQPAPTLSGGEAQRVKLSTELARKATGKTLYILDEPTTGLHTHDIKHLLGVLRELISRGNTVLVIEHNLDVIKNADWIVDLGPEGGERGGEIVAEGPPEVVAKQKTSHTGRFLTKVFNSKSKKKS